MNRQSILFVVPLPPPWAGVEQISALLAGSSLREKFDLRVLKSNIRSSNAAKGVWNIAGIIRVMSITIKLIWTLLFRRPDLVYMTLSQNATGLARDIVYLSVCKLFRVPVVAHLHGSKLAAFINGLSSFSKRMFFWSLSPVKTLIVCSRSIETELAPLLPGIRLVAVYNACPPSVGSSDHRIPEKKRAPVVAFMGHLSVAKGFYDLLAAAELIVNSYPDVRFEFAGERLDVERNVTSVAGNAGGRPWEKFEQFSGDHPNNVRLNGIVTGEAKTEFLRNSDIFVMPSHAESFSLAALEAMNAGLPLVATPVGFLPEVLKETENVFFITPGDTTALADRIKKLIADISLREKMGSANKTIAQQFSIERMVSEMERIFQGVF